MKWNQILTSATGRGVRSSEFRALYLYDKLVLVAVLFLPFQFALTVNIGSPLKISEVLVGIAVVVRIVMLRRAPWRWSIDQTFVAVIAVCVILSTLIALITMDSGQDVKGVHRSLTVDLLVYCGYGVFVLVFWALLRMIDSRLIRDTLIQSLWLCLGAVIFQATFLALRLPGVLDVFGFDSRYRGQELLGIQLARSGPFLEGQHLGFYAGAMFVVTLYARHYVGAAAALLCVLYSQSTTGIGGIAAAIVVAALLRPTKRVLIVLGAALVAGTALIALIPRIRDAVIFQLAKLGLVAPESDVNFTQSLDIRVVKSEIGWRMMWDNLLGVGPGRYSANFSTYWNDYELPKYYYEQDMRAIAENGYVHLGAENGVLALAAFIALLIWTLVKVFRLGAGGIALIVFVAIAFSTQSSWTFMPIWAILALLASTARSSPTVETSKSATKVTAANPG